MSSAPRPVPPSLNTWNAEFLDEQYRRYQSDPGSVTADLRAFFQGFDLAMAGELRLSPGAGIAPPAPMTIASTPPVVAPTPARQDGAVRITPGAGRPAGRASHFQAVVDDLIGAYRNHGHLCAKIDPLGRERERPVTLTLEYHELTAQDLDRGVDADALGVAGELPLREVIRRLEETYCGTIGVEFMHIQDEEQRAWLLERFERAGGRIELDRARRAHILEQLVRSDLFEKFLGKRYPGEKRFSLEGAEALIPLLNHLIESASNLGVEEVVLGMAHRGRLNVLNNVIGKTYEQIFTEFEENWTPDYADASGDVKYHKGYSGTRRFPNGRMVHLAMASNPSHLEAVDGVVEGRCRAKQRLRGDHERERVIPVLIHGDAAVTGQGVVAEVLNMSQLEGYTTGGTVHVVVNNQIGFTTIPEDGRSSRYCTDIGKAIDAPILHVNGDDPEVCAAAAQFAIEYRERFKRDVFIDMVCFRRYGHNEQDEVSFTQPLMVRLIKDKAGVLEVYTQRLLGEGVIQDADVQAIKHRLDDALEKAQAAAREAPDDPTIDPGSAKWEGLTHGFSFAPVETGVSIEALKEVCEALGRTPEGFNVNPKLKALLKQRASLTETGDISYADAEALAYGTLLAEGTAVRLSGQDCRRGTFSHRHAVLRDFETGEAYIPLNHIREMGQPGTDQPPGSIGADAKPRQAKFCVYDSPLSEASVVAFEYGYSLADPNMLVLWEAQFGDFCNGAQVIIDQFLASAEAKWERWSGLTMLLPHGYEGAGPEHSSARMERFLKLCGNNNMQVAYPTDASQTFHLLRRQIKRTFRKPLIVMTPKSLLRVNTSNIQELADGSFREIIDDPMFARDDADRGKVRKIVLCCGKIYFELNERRRELALDDVAIVRIEQVYPFHTELFAQIMGRYPDAAERVYVQEEPRNAAAYLFVSDQMQEKLGMERPRYIGRPAAGSPATGSKRQHKKEQEQILSEAIGPKPERDQKDNPQPRRVAASA
ncbi:MAG: 2-oxoglutarate dehydrogenase E1 component [Phycisphaerales bacterium]